jgi:hypothetical protein
MINLFYFSLLELPHPSSASRLTTPSPSGEELSAVFKYLLDFNVVRFEFSLNE